MAGSYLHCVDDDSVLLPPAVLAAMLRRVATSAAGEKLYVKIWWLANGNQEYVSEAWVSYRDGIPMAPAGKRSRKLDGARVESFRQPRPFRRLKVLAVLALAVGLAALALGVVRLASGLPLWLGFLLGGLSLLVGAGLFLQRPPKESGPTTELS